MRFDADKFLFLYDNEYGQQKPRQVEGVKFLLECISDDRHVVDLRWAAYMLATAKHETAHTMQPIAEYTKGSGRKYGIPDKKTRQTYYGRGYVQITHKTNYESMGRVFGLDFVNNPDIAMRPEIAYRIMSHGMRNGSFTGVRLSMYINAEYCDYLNARKIINGIDCAKLIAGYAAKIQTMLEQSQEVANVPAV